MESKYGPDGVVPEVVSGSHPNSRSRPGWLSALLSLWRNLKDDDVEADLLRPRCCRSDRTAGLR
jgi:hypothetical protein